MMKDLGLVRRSLWTAVHQRVLHAATVGACRSGGTGRDHSLRESFGRAYWVIELIVGEAQLRLEATSRNLRRVRGEIGKILIPT